MTPQRIAVPVLFGLALVGMALVSCAPSQSSADKPTTVEATPRAPVPVQPAVNLPRAVLPDGSVITLELAVTPEEISQGLMFRPSLPDDRGMIFLFGVDRVPSFWMKNTMIPLDLIFLRGDGTVAEIIERAQPCAAEPCPQYIPSTAAWAVLEVAAGVVDRHGLSAGDQITFERVPGYPITK